MHHGVPPLAHLAFGDGPPTFDPVVHYVPGNHDHHEWEITRESQYVTYVSDQPADAVLAAPWHTTKLLPSAENPVAGSALLTGLARSQAGGTGVKVKVSYPNLALQTPDGRRCLVVSHGHFTESIYTLMSQLRNILYPGQGQGPIEASTASRKRTSPGSTFSGPRSAALVRWARTWA